ncbi:MAG TPA: glycosyltransferase [Solirubrobacterales bacterium]|nr:glycosyltransferase [Solirubrobacterales bacterium]
MNGVLRALNELTLAYFIVLDAIYLAMAAIGWWAVESYVRIRSARDYDRVRTSPLSPALTILVPAYNEELAIVTSVRALLANRYPSLQVLVINDGSSDSTLEALRGAFDLRPVLRTPSSSLPTARVRGIYASPTEPRLTVIDKENGGKADSLNAGLRFARTPLFCSIDADTMLDPDALSRIVWEFEARPETVAAGGIVRVVNGSQVKEGRVTEVRTPKAWLPTLQILEYLRAFLGGRIAWSRLGMLLIISGAFGLFRRDVVVEAGGYDTETVGEDAELVMRLHRHQRDHGRSSRIIFFPDPICWTEAPTSLRVLSRQRDRWQRGLLQMLWKHRGMLGRRRYGAVGMVGFPYFAVFEAVGPLIEVAGYLVFAISLATGAVSWAFALLFLILALGFGFVISFMTLLMEERAFRRYPSWPSLGRLLAASIVENFGYRQLLSLIRARAWWTELRGTSGWGEMTRSGLGGAIPAEREVAEN